MAVIVPSVLALGSTFYKGISGYNQAQQGKDMMNNLHRPTYQTPNEIYGNLNLAKSAYLDERLPGEGTALNRIQGNTSAAVQQAQQYGRTPAEIMAAITGASGNADSAVNDLATKGAQYHLGAQHDYQSALQTLAGYKDQEFNINQLQPYNQDRQYAQDLIGAGNKNLNSAVGEVGTFAGTDAGSKSLGGLYDKFFGKSNTTGGSEPFDYSNLYPEQPNQTNVGQNGNGLDYGIDNGTQFTPPTPNRYKFE